MSILLIVKIETGAADGQNLPIGLPKNEQNSSVPPEHHGLFLWCSIREHRVCTGAMKDC